MQEVLSKYNRSCPSKTATEEHHTGEENHQRIHNMFHTLIVRIGCLDLSC